jgi:hypothetical protein
MGDQCCSTEGKENKGGGCCGTKKLIVAVLIGVLIFAAGVAFGKKCPMSSGATCPMPSMQK